jgi:hypothetical protein
LWALLSYSVRSCPFPCDYTTVIVACIA